MNDIIVNKFHNTLVDYEKNSSKFILPELFFIVLCNFITPCDEIEKYVKKQFLSLIEENHKLPLCAYYNEKCCAFLFSSRISDSHIFNGNQQQIISYFNSRATLEIKKYVDTKIVELNSHTKIISYFQNILFSHSKGICIGTFIKMVGSKFLTLTEMPNIKDCEQYKNFIFT